MKLKERLDVKKLALMQPTFAPDLYDLASMLQADLVILQDLEPWSRKGRVHRAVIRTPEGTQHINIPVRTEDRRKKIGEVRIDQNIAWTDRIIQSLQYNYRNSIYFDHYEPEIRADFGEGREFEYLLPFVLFLRHRLFSFLELDIREKEKLSSELDMYDSDPDLLIARMSADTLFQESGSRHYQRQSAKRRDPRFSHPVYRQHFEGFEEGCSLYDILFQFGPESYKILDQLR